jgi:predicted small secreted protein
MIKEKLVVLVVALGLAAGVTGCNTVKGAGKDVQAAGKAVEKASDKARH